MSKVLVDRELLERLLEYIPNQGTDPISGVERVEPEEVQIRALLAQPAEAEGVGGDSHEPPRSFGDVLREADVLLKLGRANKRIDELQAENERLTQLLMSVMTRHFAERLKDRADSQRLDECLSEGIAMLEAERDLLLAALERTVDYHVPGINPLSDAANLSAMGVIEKVKQPVITGESE